MARTDGILKKLLYLGYYLKQLNWEKLNRFHAYARRSTRQLDIRLWLKTLLSVLRYNISLEEYYLFRFFQRPAAFSFAQAEELKRFPEVLQSGLDTFESVFGYRATAFTPPAQQFHPSLYPALWENGIQAIDRPLTYRQHWGDGKYKRAISRLHCNKSTGKATIVRNVVFEPTDDRNVDWTEFTLKQIEAAFRWRKPAIISSHRVNFCGHIAPKNRSKGLSALKQLLKKVIKKCPDVEFVSIAQLVEEMQNQKNV